MIDVNELDLVSSAIRKDADGFALTIEVMGPNRELLSRIRDLVHEFIDSGCNPAFQQAGFGDCTPPSEPKVANQYGDDEELRLWILENANMKTKVSFIVALRRARNLGLVEAKEWVEKHMWKDCE